MIKTTVFYHFFIVVKELAAMSYYQQASNFEYSDHGLQRVKERLKMKDKTD